MIFDKELLLRAVKGIEIAWMEQYANSPDIWLLGDKRDQFPYLTPAIYHELPIDGILNRFIYYAEHPAGFVRYFIHSGNEKDMGEGYGGAKFTTTLHSGVTKNLVGPWSSRAAVTNIAVRRNPDVSPPVHEVADIAFKGLYNIGTAIKTAALVFLFEEFQMPYYLFQYNHKKGGEGSPVYVSTRPIKVVKPSGRELLFGERYGEHPDFEYQLLYAPS